MFLVSLEWHNCNTHTETHTRTHAHNLSFLLLSISELWSLWAKVYLSFWVKVKVQQHLETNIQNQMSLWKLVPWCVVGVVGGGNKNIKHHWGFHRISEFSQFHWGFNSHWRWLPMLGRNPGDVGLNPKLWQLGHPGVASDLLPSRAYFAAFPCLLSQNFERNDGVQVVISVQSSLGHF